MSTIEDSLRANQKYASTFNRGRLPMPPAKQVAIVACMDARLTIETMLGLQTGDAHIIRNAGGIVSDDVIRSLVISQQLLGTCEVMIINHTDCGMLTFRDHELSERLGRETGNNVAMHFHSFTNVEQNVRAQIDKVRSHPWIPESITVRGFVYDVKTGVLHEVSQAESRRVA